MMTHDYIDKQHILARTITFDDLDTHIPLDTYSDLRPTDDSSDTHIQPTYLGLIHTHTIQ